MPRRGIFIKIMSRTHEVLSNGPVWEWQIRRKRSQARLVNRIGIGTLGVTLTLIGMGMVNSQRQSADFGVIVTPIRDEVIVEGVTSEKFNKEFDAIFDEGISQFKVTPKTEEEMRLTKKDGLTISLERTSDKKIRRIWTQTPMLTTANNPPGREFPYSTVIYDVKAGEEPKKTVITGSISPEGIIRRPEKIEEFVPSISELEELINSASEEFAKQKTQHQSLRK